MIDAIDTSLDLARLALSDLRAALDSGASSPDVRRAHDRLSASLREVDRQFHSRARVERN